MLCPKCESQMRTYERNGINIEQCTSCKGIFLDRGELEHLINNEGSFYTPPAAAPQAPRAPYPAQPQQAYQQPYYPKKKKNFLEDIFDF